ncbi:methyltransferase family protein [Paenibacillus sanguinis]|uniref:methyltransferase family protein n=1 Tax=Paenibacillus sanguinis TaxID=225906 RepID=UPI00036898DF|nr:isoprenylcysteine carboxylmethyltransferase family protein [Paenibacillus sanguinis]
MNGFLLLIPFVLIRFGLLSLLGKQALRRAAFFAPLIGGERAAYWCYQISNLLILIYPFFLKVTTEKPWLYAGLTTYGLGILLCLAAVVNFAKPAANGMNLDGLYRLSRNPMYIAYFIYFLGCALLTQSFLLFVIVMVFQISGHWIILAEERWCLQKFGQQYKHYMSKVRRYI